MFISTSQKIITTKIFNNTVVEFGKTKVAKEEFYGPKNQIKVWDVNDGNLVISKLAKTKKNSK